MVGHQRTTLSAAARRALTNPASARDLILGRDDFRDATFARDGHVCVICGRADAGLDAHHLLERRLWGPADPRPGGYVLANSVTLCSQPHPDGTASCHLQAERTQITVQQLRDAAHITDIVLPVHLTADCAYDKWGNPQLANGMYGAGEMFFEDSVQQAITTGGMTDRYQRRTKYPRTPILPYSPKADPDDIVVDADAMFTGRHVIVTEKLDGENTTIYRDVTHARSLDSGYHPSRGWARALQGRVGHELPDGWRLCGELLSAEHHIAYRDLPGYFLLFGIYDDRNHALSWPQTVEWAALLDIPTVPVIYDGPYSQQAVRAAYAAHRPPYSDRKEGFVVRVADAFAYRDFPQSVAKAVEQDFTPGIDGHWMTSQVTFNGLADGVTP